MTNTIVLRVKAGRAERFVEGEKEVLAVENLEAEQFWRFGVDDFGTDVDVVEIKLFGVA